MRLGFLLGYDCAVFLAFAIRKDGGKKRDGY